MTTRSGSGRASGLSSTPRTTEKSAAFAPMHTASVNAAVAVNALSFQRRRRLTRKSLSTIRWYSRSGVVPPHFSLPRLRGCSSPAQGLLYERQRLGDAMGRKGIWIVVIALVLAIYAAPAAAQVSVAVGVGTPHVGAHVVVGAPVYGAYPYYPPYPYVAPYPYYEPYYYPYPVPYGPAYYRAYPGYYGGAYYRGGQ